MIRTFIEQWTASSAHAPPRLVQTVCPHVCRALAGFLGAHRRRGVPHVQRLHPLDVAASGPHSLKDARCDAHLASLEFAMGLRQIGHVARRRRAEPARDRPGGGDSRIDAGDAPAAHGEMPDDRDRHAVQAPFRPLAAARMAAEIRPATAQNIGDAAQNAERGNLHRRTIARGRLGDRTKIEHRRKYAKKNANDANYLFTSSMQTDSLHHRLNRG